DGIFTILTSKVEVGQGSRTQLTQAAAEELKVAPDRVRMVMADTDVVPDDGGTYGSLTTPRTVPAVRDAAAAAREVLAAAACAAWKVGREAVQIKDGAVSHAASGRSITYAELAASAGLQEQLASAEPAGAEWTPHGDWTVLGQTLPKTTG